MLYRDSEIEVRFRRSQWEAYIRLRSMAGQIFIGSYQSKSVAENAAKEWVDKRGETENAIRQFFSMPLRA